MQITLFGGAFNPPHLAHLLVIQQAFELLPKLDELWVLPCYQHTFQKHLAPSHRRLAMLRLLLREVPASIKNKVNLETIEIEEKLSGETFQTLQLLKTRYPKSKFSFLMGSDQLPSFTKWGNWQKLLAQMPFYVYPRNGYGDNITFPNMTLLEAKTQVITNLSSTLIQERIKQGLSLSHLLPQTIIDYIEIHQLYRR